MNSNLERYQCVPPHCSYILLKFGWACKYILPIESGMKIVELLGQAAEVKEEPDTPDRLIPINGFQITYLSDADMRKYATEPGLSLISMQDDRKEISAL